MVIFNMMINNKNLKMLSQRVLDDSDITETQRQQDLALIADVRTKINSGEYMSIDRMAMIKKAAEKNQKGKNVTLRKKLKAKSRKVMRNATEDERTMRSMDAFDERVMYSTDKEVRALADGIGITDAYNETVRFDNEWN